MKRLVAVLISIEILIITLVSIYDTVEVPRRGMLHATTGHLNLSEWDFTDTKTVSLDGEWEFYPGQFLIPQEENVLSETALQQRKFIRVPGSWLTNPALNDAGNPQGTYRLHILLPAEGAYALRTPTIRNVSAVYMNGTQIINDSAIAQEDARVNAKMHFGVADSVDQHMEIVVHIRDTHYPMGSVIHSFTFGPVEQMVELMDRQQVLDTALIVGYLILGFYYLGSFVQRRTGWFQLYFSLYCLLQGIYASLVNEQLFFILFPSVDMEMVTPLQLWLIHLSILAFLQYTYRNFRVYAHPTWVNVISVLLGVHLIIYSFPPLNDWIMVEMPGNLRFIFIHFIILFSHFYIIWILLKAFIQKTEESEYLLVITSTYTCYGLLLMLNFFYDIQIGYMQVGLFALLTISLSLLMGRRYHTVAMKAEKLTDELIRSDRLKNEFLTRSGLELQTPVAALVRLAQSLVEGSYGPLQRKQQEMVMEMSTYGKQLMKTVEEILFVANTDQHLWKLERRVFHLNMIEQVLEEVRLLLPANEAVNIRLSIHDRMPLVYADEQLVKQVVFHLLQNAIQFTKAGDISITASLLDRQIYISISDTGIGIPKEELASIFSPFYRVESTMSDGLGLGLPLAKQYVEAMGGTLSVKSKQGVGSTFTFSLPLATQVQQREWHEQQQLQAMNVEESIGEACLLLPYRYDGDKGQATILLVDDEHAHLIALIEQLQPLGYSLIAVDSGEAALQIVRTQAIDLMLVDLMMPTLSGYEVCNQIRKEYSLVDLPILMLTAGVQSADFEMTMKAGANGFIRKPFQKEMVEANITSALAIQQASQKAVHNELSYFHAQIAPHFLYNTLNSIIAMTYKDSHKAREALQHLATYFRAKLDFFRQDTLIPLEQELDLVQSYVAIEEMRYGKRLTVQFDIDEEAEGWIPAMTIQPLVENAIRHGIAKKEGGGTLCVSVQKQPNGIDIVVEDNGVGISEEQLQILVQEGEGIGFSNAFHKMKLLKNATMHVSSEQGKGTKISIFLPGVTVHESRTH